MSFLKNIGLEFIVAFLVVALFISYILRIKKSSKDAGKIEAMITNIRQQQDTIAKADRAKREFGTTPQILEDNDYAQFKDDINHRHAKIERYEPERCGIECVQFGRSPFRRN